MNPQAAVRQDGDVAIITLEGRLTLGEGCGVIHDTVRQLVEAGTRNVLLNLQAVTYIDSAGLGEMASAYVTVSKLGGQLKLVHTPARIASLLQVTRLQSLLVSFREEGEALRSFAATAPPPVSAQTAHL